MNARNHFGGQPDPRDLERNSRLAHWLQEILAIPPRATKTDVASLHDDGARLGEEYHPEFYVQLPDFVMALLSNDVQAALHYAPLLYHLIGCSTCHAAYLETYDALRATMQPDELHIRAGQNTSSMATTPPRMVVYLCQLLISQAEAVLRQARHEHTNNDAWARSLLQQAIHISAHIAQSTMRQRALRDLVEVATLFDGARGPVEQSPTAHSYAPVMSGANGTRSARITRGADTLQRPGSQAVIYLQAGTLPGMITQHEQTLELHLEGLDQQWRGRYVTIAVPLGALLEPVRWSGGNPRAIRSHGPVDEHGTLRTALGETDLQLSKAEDRNLLEAMFKKMDVQPTD